MSNDQNVIKYAKHNKVRIKAGIKREEITKMLLDFFEEIKEIHRYERIYGNG